MTAAELYDYGSYLFAGAAGGLATLDGEFTALQLQAIAAWMINPTAVAVEYHHILHQESKDP
ncbi:MAG: hypothetical protein V4636_13070 [Pseudomonadota bacterium]